VSEREENGREMNREGKSREEGGKIL